VKFRTILVGSMIGAVSLASAADAKTLTYTAALDGKADTSATGSAATARATMTVDTATQQVNLQLDVEGIALERLRAGLVKAPVGPIHLHIYAGHDHAHAEAELLLPAPYGPNYTATAKGFSVRMTNYPYATGASVLKSDVSFDKFLADLDSGDVVLNIHTETFPNGEISGVMVKKG
jgi:hypothetical protein